MLRDAQKLGIGYDAAGWLSEAHPKLRPVETNTAGIFLAGACQGPKDIPETVAQASGAAAKVLALFRMGILRQAQDAAPQAQGSTLSLSKGVSA